VNVTKPAVGWLRAYWDDEDITYYLEHDEDGWTIRQVELSGPEHTPKAGPRLPNRRMPSEKASPLSRHTKRSTARSAISH